MSEQIKLCECGCGLPAPLWKATARTLGRIKGQPARFINGHCNRKTSKGPGHEVDSVTGCWNWTGSLDVLGYGRVWIGNRKTKKAHRQYYERYVGLIPDGLTIDHLCRNKRCVNPAHLEAVSADENARRANSKLNHDQRAEVQRLYERDGLSAREISKQFGVTVETVFIVVRPIRKRNRSYRLTAEDVSVIRSTWATGEKTKTEIAKQFGVCFGTIHAILIEKNWKRGLKAA